MRQPPRLHVAPAAVDTFGDLAADLAGDYGLVPDDWQQLVLEDWLAVDRTGRWAALTCGTSCPRQNGKNGILEVRELFGMVGRGEKILHTAHEVKTARKAFKRLLYFFGRSAGDPSANFPELNALVAEVRNVNGQEAILLTNGASVEVIARSKNSGRGFTVDVLVCDEAQEMTDDDLEALMPTTSASPLGNPQWIFTGTPPGPKVNGEVFTRVREDALSDDSYKLAWHEWSCDGDVDLDDTDEWHRANPALGGRLRFEVIEGERTRFSDNGFARERLGMWSSNVSGREVIDSASWRLVADPASMAIERLTLAVDVAPDRSVAAVAFAGLRADGRWHVELDEHRRGVDWVPAWLEQRCERNRIHAVVLDAKNGLVEHRHGRPFVTGTQLAVTLASAEGRDMAIACARFFDAVMSQTLAHTDQPQLNVALSVARKRPVGDGWAWNRKDASSDITPVVASTLALWGAQEKTVKRPGGNRRRSEGRRAVVLT